MVRWKQTRPRDSYMAAKISHRSPPPSPRKTEGSFGTLINSPINKMARVGVALAAVKSEQKSASEVAREAYLGVRLLLTVNP